MYPPGEAVAGARPWRRCYREGVIPRLPLLLLLALTGCRESSIACDIVRSFSDSQGRFVIEDAERLQLVRACLLRDEAIERASEALEPPPAPEE